MFLDQGIQVPGSDSLEVSESGEYADNDLVMVRDAVTKENRGYFEARFISSGDSSFYSTI